MTGGSVTDPGVPGTTVGDRGANRITRSRDQRAEGEGQTRKG